MATTHRVETIYDDESDSGRASWECDCGRGGSASEDRVDLASDSHIDYGAGDHRIDVHH